jgi:outer membrane lipoprotein-sorting protein
MMTRERMLGGPAIAALLAVCSPAPAAVAGDLPPADEVLAAYGEAIGGEALDKVKNMSAEFEFEMPMQGVYSTGVELWERPGKLYFRIDLASMGVADYEAGTLDGLAWESHPMNGTRKLEGVESREQLRRASLNPFSSWKEVFGKAETVAEEAVGEKACYKVVLTPAEGPPLSAWFEKDTGLLLRQEIGGPGGSTTTVDLSDYQESAGILSPRMVDQTGLQSYSIKYTSVAYDVDDIPEDAFDVPASLAATAPAPPAPAAN